MITAAKPPDNRKLGLLEVPLTKQRLRPQWGAALDWVGDDIEQIIINSSFLKNAPFSWVTIAVRYGLKDDDNPSYQSKRCRGRCVYIKHAGPGALKRGKNREEHHCAILRRRA